jgi:hypothetical protein
MCDSYRFRAGRTYELPAPRTTPLSLPRLRSGHPPARRRFTIPCRPWAPLQKSGAPLLELPVRELVPAVPDMFVTPSWLAACSTFERRAACDPATSRHHRQAPAWAHARIFFRAGQLAADIPVPVTAAQSSYCHPPKGSWKKIPLQSRRRETLGPYRTDERSARIPSTPPDRQRSRGRQ